MKPIKILVPIIIAATLMQSCAIVRPGEVGVDTLFGKVKSDVMKPGPHHFLGFIGRKIERFDTRIINYSRELNFHTQEGIEVTSEITILYHIIPDSVIRIYQDFGAGYQETVIEDNLITILRQTGLVMACTSWEAYRLLS
ncbi:MAG: hypothetical protein CMB80_17070 [Flammeovirgaceae bacterium]|nr:hypothetical protein [Flammeovirgaceae bacterium]|tara:strand:- start:1564 stop:1983 length:420 start_codon:yes stop_codon:yes gene_type:complete